MVVPKEFEIDGLREICELEKLNLSEIAEKLAGNKQTINIILMEARQNNIENFKVQIKNIGLKGQNSGISMIYNLKRDTTELSLVIDNVFKKLKEIARGAEYSLENFFQVLDQEFHQTLLVDSE